MLQLQNAGGLYTQEEMATVLGLTVSAVSKRIAKSGITPDGKKLSKNGYQVPAYSLEKLNIFQEENRKKFAEVARRVDSAVETFSKQENLGLVLQSTVARMDSNQKAVMAAALIQDLMAERDELKRGVEQLELERFDLATDKSNLLNRNGMITDTHDEYWSWRKIKDVYGDCIVNGKPLSEYSTWRCSALMRGDLYLGDAVDCRFEITQGSQYEKTLFNISQVISFLGLDID